MNTQWKIFAATALACHWPLTILAAQRSHLEALSLSSPDIHNFKLIPEPFVLNGFDCSGGNISPTLEWRGVPPGTKSFAITLFDRDEHGTPSGWWHWVIYDLPADVHRLPQGAGAEKSGALPRGAVQGRNDDSQDTYVGPCPDPGDPPHRYVFTLYALSVANLPVPAEASGAMVTYTANGYTLGKATLVGLYRQEHAKSARQ